MVETCERLNEHVDTLISVLVSTGSEEVEGVVRLEVVVAVEVASNKVMDLFLGLLMKILEFVDGRELGDIETVGQDTIGLSLEEMLGLEGSDVRNGGEDVASVCGSALYAVSVVDTSLSSLSIDIEVLEIVVEIDGTSTEITTQKSGVGGEDGGHINSALLGQRQSNTGQPLVEVGNDSLLLLVADKLFTKSAIRTSLRETTSYLAQEPSDQITKDDGLVCLVIAYWGGNAGAVPQISLPLIQVLVGSLGVEEQDSGGALDEPSTIKHTNSPVLH